MSGYLPIADHGLIGDLHSVALVGTDGTIDWYCCPRFDSPSVFASILDARRGGHYRLAPANQGWSSKQLYFPDTNVLITRFLTPGGVGEVEDFMPVAQTIGGEHRQRLVRRVVAVRGQVRFELECSPRFDYGRAEHTVEPHGHGALFQSANCALALETDAPLRAYDGAAQASFNLSQGESATFVLEHVIGEYEPHGHSAQQIRELAEATVAYWRRWLSQSRYTGRWREMVHRSVAVVPVALAADLLGKRCRRRRDDSPRRRVGQQLQRQRGVDSGRGVLALCAPAPRLWRGGCCLHGLAERAVSRLPRRRIRAAPDHVRHRRPHRATRGGADSSRGLSRFGSREDR